MSRSRLEIQTEIDNERTALERNKMGQFATPPELAAAIAREALRYRSVEPIRFLEPALGTGAFYEALLGVVEEKGIERAVGIEIDARFAQASRSLWAGSDLRVENEDFTLATPREHERFNLVLTNPPYVRHHHLKAEDKSRLVRLSEAVIGRKVSGLTGLYVYFTLLADRWLEEGAVCAWLIPSEFMDVNYGQALKTYLMERVELLRVHRYCPSDVRFSDALVTSTVVFFRKATPNPGYRVRFTFGPELDRPEEDRLVLLSDLSAEGKWSVLAAGESLGVRATVRLGDLVSIRRGIATGDNGFFLISREEARRHGIPRDFIKPVLPSPRYLDSDTIEGDAEGFPVLDRQLALIDCAESEESLAQSHPRFYAYLQTGKDRGVHEGYLARSRSPWYRQESRTPPPLLCTYMGRSTNGRSPFRIILNRSEAVATNVYLMLYPKPWLRAIADHSRILAELVRNVSAASFAKEGRIYGGGLQKMEPKELARLPIDVPDEWKTLMRDQPALEL